MMTCEGDHGAASSNATLGCRVMARGSGGAVPPLAWEPVPHRWATTLSVRRGLSMRPGWLNDVVACLGAANGADLLAG